MHDVKFYGKSIATVKLLKTVQAKQWPVYMQNACVDLSRFHLKYKRSIGEIYAKYVYN